MVNMRNPKGKMRKGGGDRSPDQMQAFITDRGTIVTEEILKAHEMDGSVTSTQYKAGAKFSKQFIEPPKDFALLLNWMDLDTVHSSCIHAKKGDTVGVPWEIKPEEDKSADQVVNDPNYKYLVHFFSKVNSKEDIKSLLKKVYIDYDGSGTGYIEVSRDAKNIINGLFHAPVINIRWHKDGKRLAQIIGNKKIWFKSFGEERILNRITGDWSEETPPEEMANELIQINQHTWKSRYYGQPDWFPVVYAIFGSYNEKKYNIDFFANYGVPAYAILIKGGTLNQETRDEIKKYFETELKGSNHQTLTMSMPQSTDITFQQLNVDIKDSSFRMYRLDNRDEVLSGHRVPPYRVGIVQQGQLGGDVAESTDRIYLDSVVNPRQEEFLWVLNEQIIKEGLQIEGWLFDFIDIDIADAEKRSKIHDVYFKMGVLTINDILLDLNKDPLEDEIGNVRFIQSGMVPLTIDGEVEDTETENEETSSDATSDQDTETQT